MHNYHASRGASRSSNGSARQSFGAPSSYNRGPRPSSSSRGPRGQRPIKSVDPRLLVKKAEPLVDQVPYVPQHQFSEFEITDQLKKSIVMRGYTVPTPIQDQAIPELLAGRDVVGIANTGTGKTAAFLIPLLNQLIQDRNQKILIVAPTRELAGQIKQEAMAFAQTFYLSAALCIGGVSISRQIDALRRNPDMVIGTPGRLKDLYQQRRIDFSQFRAIVLDEVDRMLDMGFVRDVRMIISLLPPKRQSLFFSATISPEVRALMPAFLDNPIVVSVKSQETALNVDQDVVPVNGRNKLDVLIELLDQPQFEKVIIFGRTKHGVEKVARHLGERGYGVVALHGNKNQNQRVKALESFKRGQANILLATDVAARGLDIANVSHVINFDLPETYEDYVHRIGRTGRAGKTGVALSLVG